MKDHQVVTTELISWKCKDRLSSRYVGKNDEKIRTLTSDRGGREKKEKVRMREGGDCISAE